METDRAATERLRTLIDAGLDREAARIGILDSVRGMGHGARESVGGMMQPLTQLGQLGPILGSVVAGIKPDQLDVPTACDSYTVRGVLEHMITGATGFTAAFSRTQPGEPDLSDVLRDFGPTLGALAESMTAPGALDTVIEAPFGSVPGEDFARFVVLDGLIHGWDLATATGQPYAPTDELVSAVTTFAEQALDPLRDGETFAHATIPPVDASPIERLAALSGRSVSR